MDKYSPMDLNSHKKVFSEPETPEKPDFPKDVGSQEVQIIIGGGGGPPRIQQSGGQQQPLQQQPQSNMILPEGFNLMNVQEVKQKDPFKVLEETEAVVIKQTVDLLEVLTGCEQKNRYDVFVTYNGMTIRIFSCKESSGWCMRNCCPGSARSFVMSVTYVGNVAGNQDLNFLNKVAVFNRPFKCTCLCCARPEMTVTWCLDNPQGRTIGTVQYPWNCCNEEFLVLTNAGIRYKIVGNCCQMGMMCKSSVGRCMEVLFDIYRIENPNTPCGKIIKVAKCTSCITNADTFNLFYPKDATPEEKMLLISCTLMLDYSFFEDEGGNQGKGPDMSISI